MVDNAQLPRKILLVDDDPAVAEALDNMLRKHQIQVVRAIDFDSATYLFNQQIFEVCVIELEFGPLPGLGVVQKFRANKHPERRLSGMVIASGNQKKHTDDALGAELGDIEFISKPFTDVKMLGVLARALLQKRSVAEYDAVRTLSYDAMKTGDFDAAVGHVKKNLAKIGKKGMPLLLGLYEEAKKWPEALQVVDAMIEKKQDDIAALNAKGRILLHLGKAQEARDLLEKADKLAPKNLDRIRAMASMYLKLDQPDASVAKMKELINLSPDEPDLKFDMIQSLEDAGYVQHAIGLCRETTLPAEVVRFYNNKGVIHSKTAEHTRAVHQYEAALKFYPTYKENYRIYFNLAIAEANQKTTENMQRARAALLKCLALAPEFDKAKTLLSTIEKALGSAA